MILTKLDGLNCDFKVGLINSTYDNYKDLVVRKVMSNSYRGDVTKSKAATTIKTKGTSIKWTLMKSCVT